MSDPTAAVFRADHELHAVVALIMNAEGQILSVSRKDSPTDWGLPGGKIDAGETPEQALVRELLEETGMCATNWLRVFDHRDRIKNGELHPVRCYVVLNWEHLSGWKSTEAGIVKWVQPSELLDERCSFAEYNRALFRHLGMS